MFGITVSFVVLCLALSGHAQPINVKETLPHHAPFQTATTHLSSYLLLTGGYSGDLSVLSIDSTTGNLTNLTSTRQAGAGPSWASWNPSDVSKLYVVNDNAGANATNLHRFTWDGAKLRDVEPGRSELEGTVHTRYSRRKSAASCLLSAGYGAKAVSSQALDQQQSLRNAKTSAGVTYKYSFSGKGPNTARQDQSRPHEIIDSPDGKFVYVPDLGADRVHVFRYANSTTSDAVGQNGKQDGSQCALEALAPIKTAAGDGPRHMAFFTATDQTGSRNSNAKRGGRAPLSLHPMGTTAAAAAANKTYAYLVTELGGTIRSFTYNSTTGQLSLIGLAQTTRTGIQGNSTELANVAPSEPMISPDGRFVYVANRHLPHAAKQSSRAATGRGGQDDSIALFSRNLTTGLLTGPLAQYSSGGRNPRHASLHSDGKWIAVANQGDDDGTGASLAVLRVNVTSGALEEVQRWDNITSPAFAGWWGSS
ncbi:3-carboxy-cis,cis-mucoante lactonizing enzyme [Jaminaea rosea]|uniref:3-carboxy-cis,cis-mucoante lactonizing enzyme n=1 Tax=Jaminaea rosea TaxID=1569628 RepID=A0A316V0B8_9BASI|nr:3-carboxy-cis,cis-mucoante lactonizing enzyme [Jaminaea rosea]PWN30997.1 3-carboxy-cis,cis-mucoante lactonizing enzyme [Jaminaea rosea]